MTLFRGLCAFPMTPMYDGQTIDELRLIDFLDRVVEAEVDNVCLLGSTGGFAYLSTSQRQRIVDMAIDHVAGRRPVIVGVSALRTDTAVTLARHAHSAGAKGLLLAPTSYLPLTEDEIFRHYATVAEAGDLPFCIYNNPSTTHFSFSHALIGRLAKVPNIVAVKMPPRAASDIKQELAQLREWTPPGFSIGYSGDWVAAEAMLAGCDAWHSVIAGLLPEPAKAMSEAAYAGRRTDVARIDAAFQGLWELFKVYGSFRVMHMVAEILGHGDLLPPAPLLPLPATLRGHVETAVGALADVKP